MRRGCVVFVLLVIPFLYQACTGCSDDDYPGVKRENADHPTNSYPDNEPRVERTSGEKVVIKMKKENGVYIMPVRINGTEMDFIFDTGAGLISLSDLEATFLYKQGKISKDDILGSEQFQDATGTISEGAIVNLKEVSIGNRTIHNVHASVVHNMKAPLLFGQSALEKFGKITIDYENGELTFE